MLDELDAIVVLVGGGWGRERSARSAGSMTWIVTVLRRGVLGVTGPGGLVIVCFERIGR